MRVFRLTKSKFASDLSGEGSKLYGGRWNHKGIPCLYLGSSRAMCVLEFSVHVKKEEIPDDLVFVEVILPKCEIFKLTKENLPEDWFNQRISMEIGSNILKENKYLVFQVPSAIIPDEFNYVLNPLHSDFSKVKIKSTVAYHLDERIKQ
ncbi:RES family NAD+ phosphorylase [Arcicella lustrica]|uniref:RES family NAD+ phosphorylase n=1 Tax=Arcicella lustrica TaxID=2984196 RepID=A0ABU5SDD8_9BACT|nr:RES family NAD+ phosphorylase [Arcicella sp. DC25W]MEA5425291.1 RES family NAD+ phosphorylase [Arcicella sp. DC25W]